MYLEGMTPEERAERRLAWSLAAIVGAVNTASFFVARRYTSHMTGTFSLLANALALGDALVSAAIIAAFVVGAAISTILINRADAYPSWVKKFWHSCGVNSSMDCPIAFQRSGMERAAAFPRAC